ncbi:MAG TPA: LysR substrate-binding domain-containing protein, partial [Sphingopyxis sp.]|nr:LysR substrate-binding domain-containing protein [Sphingopyxis sp.]
MQAYRRAMLRKAPPLESVEIFVAAAQGESLRAVGRRLALSPSAVSRRISALEQFLGARLFDRAGQSLALNATGARYLDDVAPAIRSIRNATEAVRSGTVTASLRVATSHSLAGWLMPFLPAFQQRTGVPVELAATRDVQTLASGEVHLAIWGDGAAPAGIEATHLLTPEAVPACAPRLVDGRSAPRAGTELADFPLLSVRAPSDLWDRWFAMARCDRRGATMLRFDTQQLAYEAAAAGTGIVLAVPPVSNGFLAEGRLTV